MQPKQKNLANDKQTIQAYEKLVDHFKGDQRKANDFMHKPNQELGGKSPLTMVGEYKTKDLNQFIDTKRRKYY